MAAPLNRARRFDAATAASLAPRLEAFAASLPAGEHAILVAIVEAAMPPLDRMVLRAPEELLSAEDLRALDELLARAEGSR